MKNSFVTSLRILLVVVPTFAIACSSTKTASNDTGTDSAVGDTGQSDVADTTTTSDATTASDSTTTTDSSDATTAADGDATTAADGDATTAADAGDATTAADAGDATTAADGDATTAADGDATTAADAGDATTAADAGDATTTADASDATTTDAATDGDASAVLAEWDFPVVDGGVSLAQTSGSLTIGAFTALGGATISADTGGGILVTPASFGTSFGITLNISGVTSLAALTTVTFVVQVDNPPTGQLLADGATTNNPGVQAQFNDNGETGYAGDYSDWNNLPLATPTTLTYTPVQSDGGLSLSSNLNAFVIQLTGGVEATDADVGVLPVLHIKNVIFN